MIARLLLTLFVSLPMGALATISGPTSSSTGNFTLDWASGTELSELDGSGTVIGTYSGGTMGFSKPIGTYYFEETWCGQVPGYGYRCTTVDTHQVVVTNGTYPQAIDVQAQYEFEIHSGDFDGNGRTDLYVKRLSPGPADGSQRSYVVWNNSNGNASTTALTSPYISIAENAPINTTLNLMQVDANADGYADHILERIDQVMGTGFEQELVVFAPGTQQNKSVPQGSKQIDEDFRTFFSDVARWMNDEDYIANNFFMTTVPVFAVGYSCTSYVWLESAYNFLPTGVCFPYVYVIGYQSSQYGVNFSAVSAAAYMGGFGDSIPSESDMWELSQIIHGVIGVYAFGFDANGDRETTNTGGIDDDYDRLRAYALFLQFAIESGDEEIPDSAVENHDWTVETRICYAYQSWCTMANVACWARHYHAPFKRGGFDEAVENGDESVLVGENPIKTGVGQAAGLPPNAIGNITLPTHFLHNPNAGQWGTCPQTVPGEGTGTPPANCNQTYREPYFDEGKIWMRTRGSGPNKHPYFNLVAGKFLFKELDLQMRYVISETPGHMCPEL